MLTEKNNIEMKFQMHCLEEAVSSIFIFIRKSSAVLQSSVVLINSKKTLGVFQVNKEENGFGFIFYFLSKLKHDFETSTRRNNSQ